MSDTRNEPDFFGALLGASPDPVVVTDLDGRVVEQNRLFSELCQASGGPFLGELISTCMSEHYPDAVQHWEHVRRVVLAEGACHPTQLEIGEGANKKYLIVSASRIDSGPWGDEPRIVSYWRDITKSLKAEWDLIESHAMISRFMEMSPVGLGISEGRIIQKANPAMYRVFGYEHDDVVGNDTKKFYASEEEYERVGKKLSEEISKGRVAVVETTMLHKDGSAIDCIIQGASLDAKNPDSPVIVGIMDISDRKKAEQERRRLQMAIEQTAEMIIVVDTKGVVQFANPAFEQMTGWSLAEVQGEGSRMLIGELIEGVSFDELRHTVIAGRVWHDRAVIRRRNGSRLEIEATVSPVRNDRGEIVQVVSVSRDVTREVELEAQLRHAQKMEAIGTLAGGIAHDFNNLLHAILGFSELSMRMVPLDSRVYSNLSEVVTAAQRARDLIDQVLTFARETEQERMHMQLQTIVKEVIKLLRGSLPSTIDIVTNIDEHCGPIEADPTQMHQVVMNLCTNAFKAMRGSGGTLGVEVSEVILEPTEKPGLTDIGRGRYVKLVVRDTGHGMDRATSERIFDPYFSAWETGDGTGLGLAMVHGIVRNHGGWVDVESSPGQGSSFKMVIPVVESAELDALESLDVQSVHVLKGRVLFVDDEESNVRLGQQVLGRLGCHVIGFTSSTEALEAFMADPDGFDAIVTDQTMPRLTGAELARKVLEMRPGLSIAISTGFSDNLTEEQARKIGIREFLTKPLSVSNLERAVMRLMRQEE